LIFHSMKITVAALLFLVSLVVINSFSYSDFSKLIKRKGKDITNDALDIFYAFLPDLEDDKRNDDLNPFEGFEGAIFFQQVQRQILASSDIKLIKENIYDITYDEDNSTVVSFEAEGKTYMADVSLFHFVRVYNTGFLKAYVAYPFEFLSAFQELFTAAFRLLVQKVDGVDIDSIIDSYDLKYIVKIFYVLDSKYFMAEIDMGKIHRIVRIVEYTDIIDLDVPFIRLDKKNAGTLIDTYNRAIELFEERIEGTWGNEIVYNVYFLRTEKKDFYFFYKANGYNNGYNIEVKRDL